MFSYIKLIYNPNEIWKMENNENYCYRKLSSHDSREVLFTGVASHITDYGPVSNDKSWPRIGVIRK